MKITEILFLTTVLVLSANVFTVNARHRIIDQKQHSIIVEVEGHACMGEDKSRKQTMQEARRDAKRKAAEAAVTYIQSESRVKNFVLEKDIMDAYSRAKVRVLEEEEGKWDNEPKVGECFNVLIKAEVIPDENAMAAITKHKSGVDDPLAPLNVRVWTDKKQYRYGEKIKIFLKGNKPFYARVVYKDAVGNLTQLLPNPYRKENYFQGGVIYEIPSAKDRFEMEVSPPFGMENIFVYASTSPLGGIDLSKSGPVYYVIETDSKDVGMKSRGVILKEKSSSDTGKGAEFFEAKTVVRTGE